MDPCAGASHEACESGSREIHASSQSQLYFQTTHTPPPSQQQPARELLVQHKWLTIETVKPSLAFGPCYYSSHRRCPRLLSIASWVPLSCVSQPPSPTLPRLPWRGRLTRRCPQNTRKNGISPCEATDLQIAIHWQQSLNFNNMKMFTHTFAATLSHVNIQKSSTH